MKGPLLAALAAGSLAAIAFGGIAMAAESEDLSVPSVVVAATDAPDESGEETGDDVSSPDPGTGDEAETGDSHGLVCVLVPVENVEEATTDVTDGATPTIAELLADDDIECGGTGNDRSSEVALVPRYLAHSDEYSGAEKGAAISAWAKSISQQHSGDADVPGGPGDDTASDAADDGAPTGSAPASTGRSEEHGDSGSRGNGNGRTR